MNKQENIQNDSAHSSKAKKKLKNSDVSPLRQTDTRVSDSKQKAQ